ncbi:ion channel [Flavisphingomonas formosensis]|uniref:ion channel n=1 Tax=Flavisphingomonas formosensis TaxID=861534 RepID=UPI0012FAB93E|nr:ion channel [Sphingomonas formosensis]
MSQRPRRQTVDFRGFRAVKIGAPSALSDLYYSIMEMSWPAFALLTTLVFLLINLFFGTVYAMLPGAIRNVAPGSLLDGFFFSVETLGTVGYGDMTPATALGHGIAALEILAGLFFSATMTGLIFARFARPRGSILFSRIAVIGRHDGMPALMVRVASTRARPLADVSAQVSWLEQQEGPDGRIQRRLVELPLVRPHNPMLGLAWTLIHLLDEDSPMAAALQDMRRFNLTVTVIGVDTLLATQSIGSQLYRREDILPDHEFVDAIGDVDGVVQLDLTKLHHARPIAG